MTTFSRPITDIILERASTRTYDGQAPEAKQLAALQETVDELNREMDGWARFVIVHANSGQGEALKLGTYGYISGAVTYLVGLQREGVTDALRFGYCFETAILKATDLGIDTCWLGGTYDRGDFDILSKPEDGERIAIVSPLGQRADKKRLKEAALRRFVGADNRKTWSDIFFAESNLKGMAEEEAGAYKLPLAMVRRGPSASNKQPWRVVQTGGDLHFCLERTAGYGVAHYDMQLNDIGIAMCHFELTVQAEGLVGEWKKLEADAVPAKLPAGWEYVIKWVGVNQ